MDNEEAKCEVPRDKYNAFVQLVQREADAFGIEHRIEQENYDGVLSHWIDPPPQALSISGKFQVFWNDWKTLGREINAFTPECRRTIFPKTWERIKFEAAAELAKS